jgi:hypothetical protein
VWLEELRAVWTGGVDERRVCQLVEKESDLALDFYPPGEMRRQAPGLGVKSGALGELCHLPLLAVLKRG